MKNNIEKPAAARKRGGGINFDYQPFFDLLNKREITKYKAEFHYGIPRWIIRDMENGKNLTLNTLVYVMMLLDEKDFNLFVRLLGDK